MTKLLILFTGYTWSSPCACWLSHEPFSNCRLWPIILASPFLCWQGYILIRLATMVILKIEFAKMSAISQDLMFFFHFIHLNNILKKHDTIYISFEIPRVSLGLSNDASFLLCFLLEGIYRGYDIHFLRLCVLKFKFLIIQMKYKAP